MPHFQSLYRKYRPSEFDEVIGQDHVVKALKGAIDSDAISHAYLFSGSRGTGKTSLARIFAKALGTVEDDIYEIDAASHTSVEHIKELNEAVFTLPFRSKFKIYILDEVHMLSKSAWNAFLKTLEEPPAHVIFILATTEIEKVPETILSRCQTFIFKKPSRNILRAVIEKAGKAEGVKLEEGVSELIALFGDGAFRDAYGTLEKIIGASKDKKITLKEAEEVLGAPDEMIVLSYIEGLAEKDVEKSLGAVRKLSEKGVDIPKSFELILERFRALLLLTISKESEASLKEELSEKTFETLSALAWKKHATVSSVTLLSLLDAYARIKSCPIPEILLESAAIGITEGKA
jgi:DNA polymerase-3 subunit gamma/tau